MSALQLRSVSEAVLERSPAVDCLARGEFDFAVLELANKVSPNMVRGLVWRDPAGRTCSNPERPPVTSDELDKLPFISDVYRRHLNINNYHQTGHQHPFVDMFTGRGCSWGRCTFCLWPATINKGGTYRTRKIEGVIEEFRFIRSEMPYIKEIFLQDDTLPKERAIELSEAIIAAGLMVCWSCYSRANLDLATLKLMKKAGCRTMHVGFESSNPELLKLMKKGVSAAGMEEFARNANKAGLYIVADFLTGLPGETVETIKATAAWARKLPVQRYTFSLPKPYPETPLYLWLQEHNSIKDGHPNYPGLSAEDIYEWNKWSYRQVYMSPDYFFRMLTKPREWDRIARSAVHALPYFLNKEPSDFRNLEW